MTDPRHFAIRGGANPHTRNADDSLKVVHTETAFGQWKRYADMLLDHGIDVYVVDAGPELTGMVFAANAGFFSPKTNMFYPSRFTANHREGESKKFRAFLSDFGFETDEVPGELKFEGEADAFPIGDPSDPTWLFTHGYRSDAELLGWIEEQVDQKALQLRLTDPRFYHGDCLVCTLGGPVLGWENGLEEGAREKLESAADVIWLTDEDAHAFIGNSFYAEAGSDKLLFSPAAIREPLVAEIAERGVTVVRVDISEFFTKGGGGPKCMVFNLGVVDQQLNDFRLQRFYKTLYP